MTLIFPCSNTAQLPPRIARVAVAESGGFVVPDEVAAEMCERFGFGMAPAGDAPPVQPSAPEPVAAPEPEHQAPAPRVLSDDVDDAAAGEALAPARGRGRR